jgi:HSP20 family protein
MSADCSQDAEGESMEWVDGGTGHGGGVFALWPPVDVELEGSHVVVQVELPGVDPVADLEVCVERGSLVMRGWKRSSGGGGSHPVTERTFGRFFRSVPLPGGVDVQHAKATCRHGVLTFDAPLADVGAVDDRTIIVQTG